MQIRRLLGGYSLSGHLGRFRVTSWSPIYTWNTRFRCSTRSFRRNDIGRRLIDGRGKSGTLTLIGWPNAGDPHVSIPSAKSEERIFLVFLLVSPSERPDVAKLVEISDVHDRKRESPHFSAQASELVLSEPPMWL